MNRLTSIPSDRQFRRSTGARRIAFFISFHSRKESAMSLRHLLVASLILGPTTALVAQQTGNDFAQPRTTRRQNENKDNGRTATDRTDDKTAANDSRTARPASAATQQFILQCLLGENRNEVALARIAEQHASSKEVKDFAQMMIKDHTQLISQLERLQTGASNSSEHSSTPQTTSGDRASGADGNANNDPPRLRDPQPQGNERTASGTDRGTEPAEGSRTKAASGNFAATGPFAELTSIKAEIGQQCLASARKELEKKEGAEFDKCYMTAQAMAHQHMLDSLMVFQNHTSSDLQQLIAKASQSTEKHLDHAKELVMKLDKSGKSASTARRDTETGKE
jgi:predicted outer membrane protein